MNSSSSRKFWITGLPRCRSAWFANLLTYGDSFCYHDAFLGLDKLEDIREKLSKSRPWATNIGISDPALVLFWERMVEWYPDAKWIVVWRDVDMNWPLANHLGSLSELVFVVKPLELDFNSITANTILEVQDYLGVDIGPKERIEMLLNFNVQIDPKILRARIASVKANPPEFLKEMAA